MVFYFILFCGTRVGTSTNNSSSSNYCFEVQHCSAVWRTCYSCTVKQQMDRLGRWLLDANSNQMKEQEEEEEEEELERNYNNDNNNNNNI
ncbi:hypothetical protein T4B_11884 [Trichinella pseudospiralis]|uniref:Uncharacterized protein n=1 Tax=Trichinella pseudospiralis TaxID=6337 RepID=A0A0V1IX16_TRIPS|nr:hypothetical protein T4B_11884 [Trichinella pseudospiralis]KRZ39953.1 hypothetical protein T4C_3060 [Trichinella pseudospiralis]